MQSPNRKYIPEVDELRGFGVLLIFFYHSVHQGQAAIGGQGWVFARFAPAAMLFEPVGLSLFVVLSGFILAQGTFDQPVDYKQFITNRALRILPLMALVSLFAIFASKTAALDDVLALFLFLGNAPFRFNDPTQLTGTVWAVALAFQLYVIAPFLFRFVARGGLLGFVLPAAALILSLRLIALYPLRDTPEDMIPVLTFTIVGRLGQFMIGIALAGMFERSGMGLKRARAWGLLAISSLAVMTIAYLQNSNGGFPVWHAWRLVQPELEAVGWAGVIAGYIQARPFRWRPLQTTIMTVGVLSFSIYILHWPMTVIFWGLYKQYSAELLSHITGVLLTSGFLLLPPVIALAALSQACIEVPFLNLRKLYIPATQPDRDRAPPILETRNSFRAFAASGGATAVVAYVGWAAVSSGLVFAPSDVCAREGENLVTLSGPFVREGNFGFLLPEVPGTQDRSDDSSNPTRSTAILCEDRKTVGTPHSLHADINDKGGGRYSHWSGALYFSTPDNTDPNANGRTYQLNLVERSQERQ